jgi:coenzyme F420-0:L-glutamate ligase
MTVTIEILAAPGIPEVRPGDDLADLIMRAFTDLRSGDVVAVTSKVVSKAEGRVVEADRAAMIDVEAEEVVARRGETVIARTRLGLVLAAAGVDASNTATGTVALLPLDPDESARGLRRALAARADVNVAVVVTDTAGRAWRNGQTDIAVGCAGLAPIHSLAGRADRFGNPLTVTAPAVADEIAGAAELVKTKLAARPVAVVRGLGDLVLDRAEHGPGAAALVRARSDDMFGLGSREAVLEAVIHPTRTSPLSGGASPAQLVELVRVGLDDDIETSVLDDLVVASATATATPARAGFMLGHFAARLEILARAHGWVVSTRHGPGLSATLRFSARRP